MTAQKGRPFPADHRYRFSRRRQTSLLNAPLDPALAGTLVIVNEFGEIGLDHPLVERLTATC
jgi:hypothetical protein